jgi:hypothetical protein
MNFCRILGVWRLFVKPECESKCEAATLLFSQVESPKCHPMPPIPRELTHSIKLLPDRNYSISRTFRGGSEPFNFTVDLPVKSYPGSLDYADNAAKNLREKWNLGSDPIYSVIGVLEERSVHVLEIDAGERFDGISALAYEDKRLVAAAVVSRRGLAGERQRLNLAHELGHLVLDVPAGIDEEAAAFRFGAAFLAPAEVVRRDVGERRSFLRPDELILLKQKFGMSIQSLLYRLRDLGIIGDPYYRQWCININRLGWRRREPAEMPPEQSSWLEQSILRALGEDLMSREMAENILGRSLDVQEPLSLVERRAFIKLPLEERRQIMAKQAEHMAARYESDREWREFQEGDFVE